MSLGPRREGVLRHAAEITVRIIAEEARQDDAAPRASDDLVEAPLAWRDDAHPGSLRL
jgi:hypothetical protein